jgi:hypothetical protein
MNATLSPPVASDPRLRFVEPESIARQVDHAQRQIEEHLAPPEFLRLEQLAGGLVAAPPEEP